MAGTEAYPAIPSPCNGVRSDMLGWIATLIPPPWDGARNDTARRPAPHGRDQSDGVTINATVSPQPNLKLRAFAWPRRLCLPADHLPHV